MRSEEEADPARFARKFRVNPNQFLSGKDRITLNGRTLNECQKACI